MISSSSLVDSNLLVYSENKDSPFFDSSNDFLTKNFSYGRLFVAQQNLVEFYAIVTDPKRALNPKTADQATQVIKSWIKGEIFRIISPSKRSLESLVNLLRIYPAKGQEIFDVYLAATMIDNDIATIYTADTKIFKKLGLKAVNPL